MVTDPPGHPAPASDRPEHHRWALLTYAVVLGLGFAFAGVDRTLWMISVILTLVFFAYFIRHLSFAISAARWAEGDLEAPCVGIESYTPQLTVLVACKNEELVVDGMVTALLGLDYPDDAMTLLVVDDGSDDGTGARLDAWAAADRRLRVLHRLPGAGGGKSGALNDALEFALADIDAEIAVIFDADHEPDRGALRRLVRHFRDPSVGAVMGRCVIRNGIESSLASTIFIDYLSGYLVNEYGRQALFELPAYGGANCAVSIEVLRALGGWNPHTVTEDTDLTLRVLLMGKRVRFDPTAVDFEEAVSSTKRFWKQRHRWARGHQKCLRDYWRPAMRSPYLTVADKIETMMFLWIYHIPVMCGIGLTITVLRVFGVGGEGASAPISMAALMFAGPFAELTVGLLLGRVERRAAWMLAAFVPSFGLSILTITVAYLDGMWGREYSWVKTARTGTPGVGPASDDGQQALGVLPGTGPGPASAAASGTGPGTGTASFARRDSSLR
ncbi:MAG: 1,2-diacylglycerol 3-beta-glucosyltransferase [Actinomycetota bacterium]|nr:1,2-diacylglycerol 3-beta-glucosyltransferase [Actinomycetota bacterium]